MLEQAPDVLLGTYLGAAGDPAITKMVEEADALLLLGVIFSDTNFALSHRRLDPRGTILAFDRAVRIGHHVYTDLPIDDLIEALIERAPADAKPRKAFRPSAVPYQRNLPADDDPIVPSDVATAINDLFDRHGAMPMTADVGDCLFVAMEIENTALAAPGYYAGMGFGVPAGIGVAAATGRRDLGARTPERHGDHDLPGRYGAWGSHLGFGSYDSRSKLHFALGGGSVSRKSGSGAPAFDQCCRIERSHPDSTHRRIGRRLNGFGEK